MRHTTEDHHINTMEGHINLAFTNSLSSIALKTREQMKEIKQIQETKQQSNKGHDDERDEGLHDDSFFSDLEKNSDRGHHQDEEDAPVLHGYCDRSFEKAILTFTSGDTGPLSRPDTSNLNKHDVISYDIVDVDARQGK